MPGQILQLHSATDARPDPVHRDPARGRNQSDSDARPFADQLKLARQSSERGKALPRGRQDSAPAGRQPDTAGRPQGETRPLARPDERPLPLRKAETTREVHAGRATEPSGADAKRAAAPASVPSSTTPPVETFKARLVQSGLNKADQARALSQFRQLATDLEAMMGQAAASSEGLSGEWLDDIAKNMAQLAQLLDADVSMEDGADFSELIEVALAGVSGQHTDAEGVMPPWALDRTGSLDDLTPDADQDWFAMTGDGEWVSLDDLAESFREDRGNDEAMPLMAFSDWLAQQIDGDALSGLVSDDMAEMLSQADIDPGTPVIWLAAGDALPEAGDMDWAEWLMAVPMDDLLDDMDELESLDDLLTQDRFAALFKSEGQTPPVDGNWAVLTPVKDEQSAPPVPMLDARFADDDQGAVMPAALVGLNGDSDGDSDDVEPEIELGRDESKGRKDARQALSDALLSRLQSDTGRVGTQEDNGSLRQIFDQGGQRENPRSPQAMAREHVERQLPVKNSAGELTQQLGERLVIMIGQDIQEARIRLDPPDMGSMDIRVTTQNDQVQVQVVAQQPMVRDLLDQHAQRLREMLEQQGFTEVDVEVSEQPWQDDTSDDDADGESEGRSGDGSDDEGEDLPRATTQPLGLVDHYV